MKKSIYYKLEKRVTFDFYQKVILAHKRTLVKKH